MDFPTENHGKSIPSGALSKGILTFPGQIFLKRFQDHRDWTRVILLGISQVPLVGIIPWEREEGMGVSQTKSKPRPSNPDFPAFPTSVPAPPSWTEGPGSRT